ncbi:MAG: hypothetical protein Q8907_14550, partial [Bacteroidota bacterium]|nr:hypothetical protein [Bacteroidota bacterium]
SRVYNEINEGKTYSFITKSPSGTQDVMRILLPAKPIETILTDSKGGAVANVKEDWDEITHTCFLQFENSCDGIQVSLKW